MKITQLHTWSLIHGTIDVTKHVVTLKCIVAKFKLQMKSGYCQNLEISLLQLSGPNTELHND